MSVCFVGFFFVCFSCSKYFNNRFNRYTSCLLGTHRRLSTSKKSLTPCCPAHLPPLLIAIKTKFVQKQKTQKFRGRCSIKI